MLKIIPLSAFKDNYIWVMVNDLLGQAIVVDPGDAAPVFDFLNKYDLELVGILLTHKHADHTGGVSKLLDTYPSINVYAHQVENIPFTTHFVKNDEIILIDEWSEFFRVIHIPGHTLGHVAYYANSILFSGDTLFGAGCGRIFEGTAEQMLFSLNTLAALPRDTLIYCGHEYTLSNLHFALRVEPENENIQQRIKLTERLLANNNPSLPSIIEIEKKTNPFLRCTQESVISSVEDYAKRKLRNTVDVFYELREWKNNFKL